jgi:hypothetical protein
MMKVITIGRSRDNDIVISDSYVSGHHLQIIQDDTGSFRLADFGSKNGTYVNGRKISGEIYLNPTDVVRIGNTTLPWKSYFIQAPPVYVNNPVPPVSEPLEPKQSDSYGIFILLLGIGSIGLIAYIIINYLTSFGNQIAGMFGGMEGSLKLFPIYLRGYFGVGGQWVPMIASAVLAIVADFIDGEDSLSKAGKGMANFALVVAAIFIILALFANQIVELY